MLGLLDERTRLVGEARGQSCPLSRRDLQALRAKLRYLPEPHRDVELAFWSRGGADVSVYGAAAVRFFTCAATHPQATVEDASWPANRARSA